MSVYRDKKRGTYLVSIIYQDDTGARLRKVRRGFASRKDALLWEKKFLDEHNGRSRMLFGDLTEIYFRDMENRLKLSTVNTKRYVVNAKILPVFGDKNIFDITPAEIRSWQDDLIRSGYAPTYLRTIQQQLSAIFNYAVRYYGLPKNPCLLAGTMGKGTASEMVIWTLEDFYRFIAAVKFKPAAHAAFMILFWTGIRLGEMLALTADDIDLENKTLRVNKTMQRIHGEDVVTSPKTPKSNRILVIPDVLVEELRDYLGGMSSLTPETHIIPLSRSVIERELKRGIRRVGDLHDIHPHCLRHSHTAFIASLGATPVEAAERLGHENVSTTLNTYSHAIPGWQREIASEMDKAYKKMKENDPPADATA
ncbi:MAG: site-specific integrase [Lachnospiraceae bacterium]|nr:site-specific integrase [Lachnospiraceae bacterium]